MKIQLILMLGWSILMATSSFCAKEKPGFAVIYRGFIVAGSEKKYQEAWRKVATHFIQNCGALGSALHKTEEGEWIAYSRWPSQTLRDKFWGHPENLPKKIKEAVQQMKECADATKPRSEIRLEVVDDLIFKRQKYDIDTLSDQIVHQMEVYPQIDTKKWTYRTALKDLPVQVGSLTKLMMQLDGERYDHGMSKKEIKTKIADELADLLSLTLFIAHGLSIDMKEAWRTMLLTDQNKFVTRKRVS
jgi:NTP pyrophosphatase (non-canonical NTP hydrolase)